MSINTPKITLKDGTAVFISSLDDRKLIPLTGLDRLREDVDQRAAANQYAKNEVGVVVSLLESSCRTYPAGPTGKDFLEAKDLRETLRREAARRMDDLFSVISKPGLCNRNQAFSAVCMVANIGYDDVDVTGRVDTIAATLNQLLVELDASQRRAEAALEAAERAELLGQPKSAEAAPAAAERRHEGLLKLMEQQDDRKPRLQQEAESFESFMMSEVASLYASILLTRTTHKADGPEVEEMNVQIASIISTVWGHRLMALDRGLTPWWPTATRAGVAKGDAHASALCRIEAENMAYSYMKNRPGVKPSEGIRMMALDAKERLDIEPI